MRCRPAGIIRVDRLDTRTHILAACLIPYDGVVSFSRDERHLAGCYPTAGPVDLDARQSDAGAVASTRRAGMLLHHFRAKAAGGCRSYCLVWQDSHQYRHFFTETVNSLVVVPTSPATNPWLCRLSAMALGPAFGQDAAYDALRYAILSLASLDIGFRIHHSLANRNENAMYTTSLDQRDSAMRLLRMCQEAGGCADDSADLMLGTVLAISFRDVSGRTTGTVSASRHGVFR
jgi:hypothetical protein